MITAAIFTLTVLGFTALVLGLSIVQMTSRPKQTRQDFWTGIAVATSPWLCAVILWWRLP